MRYARFAGDVVDRAEEWRVTVNGDGSIRQLTHLLPEGRPGAKLSRADAQQVVYRLEGLLANVSPESKRVVFTLTS